MSMTEAERLLVQAEVHKTKAIFGAIRALTLAVLGEEDSPVTEVQRELSSAAGEVTKMDGATEEALTADEESVRPGDGPRRPRRRRGNGKGH